MMMNGFFLILILLFNFFNNSLGRSLKDLTKDLIESSIIYSTSYDQLFTQG